MRTYCGRNPQSRRCGRQDRDPRRAQYVLLAAPTTESVLLTAFRFRQPRRIGAMNEARVAFYGDSYTLGIGATSAARRWSTIICAERGWREFNPSVNGLGF